MFTPNVSYRQLAVLVVLLLAAGIFALLLNLRALVKPHTHSEPHPELETAWQLEDMGDLQGAIAEFRKAADLFPDKALVHTFLGDALVRTGDHAAGLAELRKGLALDPDDPATHFYLGVNLTRSGAYDEGIRELRQAVALNPQNGNYHDALGSALLEKGDKAAAIPDLREAARLEPGRAGTRYYLGLALGGTDAKDEAIRELREAIRLDPKAPESHAALAHALATMKADYKGAMIEAREAIRLKPDDPRCCAAHYALALCHVQEGQTDLALKSLNRAIQLNPNLKALAAKDPALKPLRDNAEFRAMVGK